MSRDKNSHLWLAGRPTDYQKLGIAPVEVAQFEDGQLLAEDPPSWRMTTRFEQAWTVRRVRTAGVWP